MRLSRFAPLLLACAPLAAAGARPESLALLPLENLSAAPSAAHDLGSLLAAGLSKRGWRVAAGDPVEKALDAARIRYLDSFTAAAGTELASSLDVSVLALGTVYAYDATDDPRLALALRLVARDGHTLFSELVAMRAEDAEGIFESGRSRTREELAEIAVKRLLKGLPRPGATAATLRTRGVPVHLSAPRTYRSAALAQGTRYRIAILPFANAGPHAAARIVSELLARRLAGSSLFEVVEAADLRAALVAEKIHDLSDPGEIRRLGKRLGTTLFFRGTIYEFSEPYQASAGTPRLELEATLADCATGEIVWTSYVARRGTDYRGLLQLGEITNIVRLADQAAGEMIHAAERAHPTAGPGSREPRRPVLSPPAEPARTEEEKTK